MLRDNQPRRPQSRVATGLRGWLSRNMHALAGGVIYSCMTTVSMVTTWVYSIYTSLIIDFPIGGACRVDVCIFEPFLQDWQFYKNYSEVPTCFEMYMPGVNQLTLKAKYDSRDCDLSTWADAKVYDKGMFA